MESAVADVTECEAETRSLLGGPKGSIAGPTETTPARFTAQIVPQKYKPQMMLHRLAVAGALVDFMERLLKNTLRTDDRGVPSKMSLCGYLSNASRVRFIDKLDVANSSVIKSFTIGHARFATQIWLRDLEASCFDVV
jgi:hypothetical protein